MPKRIACVGKDCVACGCCLTKCPRTAIKITGGVRAEVDSEKCIGCGICTKTCPADVITLKDREETL